MIDLDTKAAHIPPTLLPPSMGLGPLTATSGVDLFAQVMRQRSGVNRLDTRITRTPSGGLHVWFTAPPDTVIRSSRGTVHPDGHVTGLGWQIDIRAHGGYVLAPGSVTPHGTYRIVRDQPPMPLPDWLIWWLHLTTPTADCNRGQPWPPCPATGRRVGGTAGASPSRAQRIARAALINECRHITGLQDGRKAALNKAAYKLGGYVAAGYLTIQDVRHALTQAGRAADATRITASIEPGLAAGMTKPRYLHEVPRNQTRKPANPRNDV
ncbi:hypothetical protein JOF56_011023 [Kibdelosporangium banguiense]|uniref:DNA primase/polymerase bifunctional N-terminal domain-containing protein n=1 Tax=Kibdelosporangium banguiense TaxID=1365924 RepID=A0ABS4U374_9PSEU|nr:hypothetical protein [Kibdelosporangium banguiense]